MSYEPLSKLFYSDADNYKGIYEKRINDNNSIHFDFLINDNRAFVVEDKIIMSKIIDIYRMDKKIQKLCNNLPQKAVNQFEIKCLIDEIILTNNIEGIHSSRKEINTILSELENKSNNKRFKGLVQKYLMLQNGNDFHFESCEDIRNLYDELVYEEISEDDPDNLPDGQLFRKDSTSVYTSTEKEIHRGINPESKIIEYLRNALALLNNKDIEFLLRLSVFHYLFGYIHPFYDGNGRTSRYISSSLLSNEFEPVIGYRISYTIKENIKKYYDAFKICNDPKNLGDLTPFVDMFVDVIHESMEQLIIALSKRYTLLLKYKDVIPSLPNEKSDKYNILYYVLIQASLFAENGINITELTEGLSLSRSTLSKRLKYIDEQNLLIQKYAGKIKYYKINLKKLDEIINNK